jgi:ribosome assembly protein 1
LNDKISYAFQLATAQGPLCHEPVQGIAVFLEDISLHGTDEEIDIGRLTGEAIRSVRDSISQGFLDWSPRILLAMYSCEIQASSKLSSNHVFALFTKPVDKYTMMIY